ncbi:protein of unknown function [Formosa sp. Hel1_31_208]|uniref:DUF4270 domain-containing protein n=1 Tax=Formosa sp. Hel1_31_208 TaxID=1798225 RepID=UPI00087D0669|nr:DUF4270 domain-containing protein [Formosa sp. Hel1_31_208]SDR80467.1 protein of unknown function [Formosa sp. Hel1_31_208]
MKKRQIAFRNLAVLTFIVSSFIACDKDFANIDSDIINNDNATHFNTTSRDFDVLAYTKALDPVQTNNLPINYLGSYVEPNFGRSTAGFVTQLRPTLLNPDFGGDAEIDSVVLNIPYFSRAIGVTEEGETLYELDSIFGDESFNLSIYESNYFLRDFDPNATEIDEPQRYYANGSTGSDIVSQSQLEGTLLFEQLNFAPDPSQIVLTEDDEEVSRIPPALRVAFNTADDIQYWQEKIIDMSGSTELSNVNNFNNYFRGLYFKAESNTSPEGRMLLLNMASTAASITIFYTRDPFTEGAERLQTTVTLNFTGNRANFISNDFSISDGNEITGDESLYLKGGQGSVAEIKLFNGDNFDDDNTTDNPFETFKKEFVETDENGNFIKGKKLVNEANLIFYVNQDEIDGEEPNRIFLYDMNNNIPLADYFFDTSSSSDPRISRLIHLGRLQRENNEPTGNGIKYKLRITEHINNILLRDSTNVKLGLAVSGNINIEGNANQFDLLNGADTEETVPLSSIITPRGTVLYGNNTSNEEKKLYLEIFFTEPDN